MIDIATLQFSMPIWISLPAKVKKLGVIRSIVSGIHDNAGTLKDLDLGLLYGDRVAITPNQYGIIVLNGQVQLIDSADAVNNVATGTSTVVGTSTVGPNPPNWESLIDNWGKLTTSKKATIANGTSQLRISKTSEIDSTEIIGTIALHPTNKNILLFTVDPDTIPTNTLSVVDAIVDPSKKGPSAGLVAKADGQRYLIINNIGSTTNTDGADAWKGAADEDLIASANDIIQYKNNKWQVVYDASTKSASTDYLTNSKTGIQYKWDGSKWIKSYEGEYEAGRWRLVL